MKEGAKNIVANPQQAKKELGAGTQSALDYAYRIHPTTPAVSLPWDMYQAYKTYQDSQPKEPPPTPVHIPSPDAQHQEPVYARRAGSEDVLKAIEALKDAGQGPDVRVQQSPEGHAPAAPMSLQSYDPFTAVEGPSQRLAEYLKKNYPSLEPKAAQLSQAVENIRTKNQGRWVPSIPGFTSPGADTSSVQSLLDKHFFEPAKRKDQESEKSIRQPKTFVRDSRDLGDVD